MQLDGDYQASTELTRSLVHLLAVSGGKSLLLTATADGRLNVAVVGDQALPLVQQATGILKVAVTNGAGFEVIPLAEGGNVVVSGDVYTELTDAMNVANEVTVSLNHVGANDVADMVDAGKNLRTSDGGRLFLPSASGAHAFVAAGSAVDMTGYAGSEMDVLPVGDHCSIQPLASVGGAPVGNPIYLAKDHPVKLPGLAAHCTVTALTGGGAGTLFVNAR